MAPLFPMPGTTGKETPEQKRRRQRQAKASKTQGKRNQARVKNSQNAFDRRKRKNPMGVGYNVDHTKMVKRKNKKGGYSYYVDNYHEGKLLKGTRRAATKKEIEAYEGRFGDKKKKTPVRPRGNRAQTTGSAGRATGGGSGGSSGGKKSSNSTDSGTTSGDGRSVDTYFADLFAPARRSLKRQATRLDQKKKASDDAWGVFNTWMEGQRAAQQQLQTQMAADNKARNDAAIAASSSMIEQFANQTQGGISDPSLMSESAGASGVNAAAAGTQAETTQSAIDMINQRYADDQLGVDNALSKEMASDVLSGYNTGLDELAARESELDATIAEAKLDRFYKDRQYGLDKEAAAWLRESQGRQLDLQEDKIASDAATAAASARADALGDAYEQDRDALKTQQDAMKSVVGMKPENFNEISAHEQGQIMQNVAQSLKAQYYGYLGTEKAAEIMGSVFGARFRTVAGAKDDFLKIWNG
mgnify:CR=1 FL=1